MIREAFAGAALALALAHAPSAAAETYRVDLIVFLDLSAQSGEAGAPARAPNWHNAIELDDSAALAAAGITILPDADFALSDAWRRLRNSRRFRPLIRLAFEQRDPPGERGPALRLYDGQMQQIEPQTGAPGQAPGQEQEPLPPARELHTVDGSVALLLGRYLHLDVDLQFVEAGADATPGALEPLAPAPVVFELDERRLMRRGEIHHLDSPRLGVLAVVDRVDEAR